MKFLLPAKDNIIFPSLPVRGAWIEMTYLSAASRLFLVAPRAGSVD